MIPGFVVWGAIFGSKTVKNRRCQVHISVKNTVKVLQMVYYKWWRVRDTSHTQRYTSYDATIKRVWSEVRAMVPRSARQYTILREIIQKIAHFSIVEKNK